MVTNSRKKSSKKGKQPARNRPCTQKTLNIDTDCESGSITDNEKASCKQKKQKQAATDTETAKWKRTANTQRFESESQSD